jgi:hypothetical protein
LAFSVTLHTAGPVPPIQNLTDWLTEQGEPFDEEGLNQLVLRGLPVRLLLDETEGEISAQVDITPTVPLMRLVDLLFDLSVVAQADVRLVGVGEVNRPAMWMHLADDQDRRRIGMALLRSTEHGNHEEVIRRLWSVLGVLRPGMDIRWSMERGTVLEMKEVGAVGGISIEDAAWHDPETLLGDLVAVPVEGYVHGLAWRWLSEAYPGLCDSNTY